MRLPTTQHVDSLTPNALSFLRAESQGIIPYHLELDYSYWTTGMYLLLFLRLE